jgi:hypothetical protein
MAATSLSCAPWAKRPGDAFAPPIEVSGPGDIDLAALVKRPACAGIEMLELGNSKLSVDGLRSLAQSPVMPRLRWLRLWKCELDAAAVAALFSTDAGRRLEHLSLTWNPLGPDLLPDFEPGPSALLCKTGKRGWRTDIGHLRR